MHNLHINNKRNEPKNDHDRQATKDDTERLNAAALILPPPPHLPRLAHTGLARPRRAALLIVVSVHVGQSG